MFANPSVSTNFVSGGFASKITPVFSFDYQDSHYIQRLNATLKLETTALKLSRKSPPMCDFAAVRLQSCGVGGGFENSLYIKGGLSPNTK